MSESRAWPVRYAVRLRTNRGDVHEYRVLTWHSEAKAVAMAVSAHGAAHAADGGAAVADVEVEELGPAEAAADGTVSITRGDLVDRMEF